jgi:hypothetical protein
VEAKKNGVSGFVHLSNSDEESKQLLRIKQIQERIPMAAKIVEVIEDRIFVIEKARGVLLWEIEDATRLPEFLEIQNALDSFVASLKSVGLVHGDIRPWNIFYDSGIRTFKIIDWGFSFFSNDGVPGRTRNHLRLRGHDSLPPETVDAADAWKTISVLKGEETFEAAWGHDSSEMLWRPSWAKRHVPGLRFPQDPPIAFRQ